MGGVNIGVQDNQLGTVPPGTGQGEVVIGVGSGGTVPNYQPYTLTGAAPSVFQTNSGSGPGPRLAAFGAATGNPITYVQIPIVSNGTVSAVGYGSSNVGSMTLTITGNPNDDYYLVVTALQGGAAFGTGPLIVGISLDGGQTNAFTVNMGTATTVTTGSAFTTYTGLTLTFAGTPTTGDYAYAVCTAPQGNDAGVQSALLAVAAINNLEFQDVFVAGVWGASDATNFDGYMQTLTSTYKDPARLYCSADDATWGGTSTQTEVAWLNSTVSAFANNSTTRTGVCAGYYRFTDPFTQSLTRSSCIYGLLARISSIRPSQDPAEVDLGAIPNLTLPTSADKFANGTFVYHNDNFLSGFQAARFTCMAQWKKYPGMYFLPAQLMAPPGSDYGLLVHGHVIDLVWDAVYAFFTQQLSKAVRVSAKTGYILPQVQAKLQNGSNAAIANAVGTNISAYATAVSGTDNILSTSTLTVNVYSVPLAYLNTINATLALVNPVITQTFPVPLIQVAA